MNIYLEKIASTAFVRNFTRGAIKATAATKGDVRKIGTLNTNIATKAIGGGMQSRGTLGMLKDNRDALSFAKKNPAANKSARMTGSDARSNAKNILSGSRDKVMDGEMNLSHTRAKLGLGSYGK